MNKLKCNGRLSCFLLLLVVLSCGVILFKLLLSKKTSEMARMSADKGVYILRNVDFEVFGLVQGVFFRMHTKKTAVKYGLVGWVQNTKRNTVIGQAQGPTEKLKKLKAWLQNVGSPSSSISRAEFKNEKNIDSLAFQDFKIRR